MKVSYDWLNQYIDIAEFTPERIAEILTEIGLEVEGLEKFESVKGGLRGIVVGKVRTCGSHPNADRLQLTTVDIGEDQPVQIVCGAPNVAPGQTVPVATVGTSLYDRDGNSFSIRKSKIRDEISHGMICSEKEIGLGEDASGIMVLPEDWKAGTPLADYYDIREDFIFDIDLTPNRADALCHIGVAEDLVAYVNTNHDGEIEMEYPDFPPFEPENPRDVPQVDVREPDLCERYAGIIIENLTISPSPKWLQDRLKAIGVKPVNNVVDITNFVLHELGQPLHAFDMAEVGEDGVIVDTAKPGMKFTTLDGQKRTLKGGELVIFNGNEEPMCLAGVFGGEGSGVKANTKAIFLESAYFNAASIRKTSMGHNLRTEAARVYEKGADPNRVLLALQRATHLITELAGGKVSTTSFDSLPDGKPRPEVVLRFNKIRQYLGVDLSKKEILDILQRLKMGILAEEDESLTIGVPTNKPDVLREVDVIEEVIRIYGIGKIPIPEKAQLHFQSHDYPDDFQIREKTSQMLIGAGLSESMGLSLTNSRYYGGTPLETRLVRVNNTSNKNLDAMRPDIWISLLSSVAVNHSWRTTDLSIFELGRIYHMTEAGQTQEENVLGLALSGRVVPESWTVSGKSGADYYRLKGLVHQLLRFLGVPNWECESVEEHYALQYGQHFLVDGRKIATLGKVDEAFANQLKREKEVMAAQIYWDRCLRMIRDREVLVEAPSRYPAVERDLAIVIDREVQFEDIYQKIQDVPSEWVRQIELFDTYENAEQLGKGKKSYAIRLVLQSNEKTLKDKEVDRLLDRIISALKQEFGASLR